MAHTGANRGATTMFANMAMSGICENNAAENGVAVKEEASVSAAASIANAGHRERSVFNQQAMRDPKTMIPNVESVESAKETDKAAPGSMTTTPSTQTASALSAADRRMNDEQESAAMVITHARNAEIGIAVKIRYARMKMACTVEASHLGARSLLVTLPTNAATKLR